jgi:ankyrin repeat protein
LEKGAKIDALDKDGNTPLIIACRNLPEAADMVSLLLKYGAQARACSNNGNSILHELCLSYKPIPENILKLLIEKGAQIDALDKEGNTPLIIACQDQPRSADKVALLLRCGASPLAAATNWPSKGFTPLHFLAHKYTTIPLGLLQLLVEKGAKIDALDKDGNTPLMIACRGLPESVESIVSLVKQGASVTRCFSNGSSLLHVLCAFRQGLTENILQLLLDKGAQIDAADKEGNTPLMIAFRNLPQLDPVASLLLRHGASPTACANNGYTLLHTAYAEGSRIPEETLKMLLDKGVKIDAPDKEGCTPLMLACEHFSTLADTISLLINQGASPAACASDGRTVFHFLARWGREIPESLLQQLVDKGAKIDAPDKEGNTPLLIACQCLSLSADTISLLIKLGASPKVSQADGRTLLHFLAETGEAIPESLLQQLVDKGVTIDAVDKEGNTPLLIACRNLPQSAPFVRWLINHHANVNASNHGRSVLGTVSAESSRISHEIIELLLRNGARGEEIHVQGNTFLHLLAKWKFYDLILSQFKRETIPIDVTACNSRGETLLDILLGEETPEATKTAITILLPQFEKEIDSATLPEFLCHIEEAAKEFLENKETIFEAAFLLRRSSLPRAFLAHGVDEKTFSASCDKLAAHYPASRALDLAAPIRFRINTLYDIGSEHLKKNLTKSAIPPKPEGISCDQLKELFKKINVIDSKETDSFVAPSCFHIHNQEEGLATIDRFLDFMINKRIYGLSKPEQYQEFENALCHIIKKLNGVDLGTKDGYNFLVSTMSDIFRLIQICGPAASAELIELYYKVVRETDLSLENKILLDLSDVRRSLLQTLIAAHIPESAQTRHDYIAIVKKYPELALSESAIWATKEDVFSDCASPETHLTIVSRFWEQYTPATIVEWCRIYFLGVAAHRDSFIDWLKGHIPPSFRPDLEKKEDREYAYLEEVYNQEGRLKDEIIIHALQEMQIIQPFTKQTS